jgi:hypothetical protein
MESPTLQPYRADREYGQPGETEHGEQHVDDRSESGDAQALDEQRSKQHEQDHERETTEPAPPPKPNAASIVAPALGV